MDSFHLEGEPPTHMSLFSLLKHRMYHKNITVSEYDRYYLRPEVIEVSFKPPNITHFECIREC